MDTKVTLIKRYSNRKMYCTATSRYVKLYDIMMKVLRGEDILVIDNETKADITARILTMTIQEYDLRCDRFKPVAELRDIIRGDDVP